MDERPVTRRQFTALTAAVCALGLVAVAGPIVVYEATRSTGGSGTAAVAGVLTPASVAPPSGQSGQLPGGAGASEPTGPVTGPAADPVHRPAYAITASVDPRGGLVDGAERVRVPAGVGGSPLRFRVLAGARDYGGDFRLGTTSIDGRTVHPNLDDSLLSVARPPGRATTVELHFRYTLRRGTEPSSAGGLGLGLGGGSGAPSVLDLLARFDTGLSMGHWYPALLAEGDIARATLPANGDIGASPAADITADISVPAGHSVISGGVTTRAHSSRGTTQVTQRGHALRELSLVVSDQLVETRQQVGGARVRVWSTADGRSDATRVAGYVATGIGVYSRDFGRYPWPELNVVEAPMPAGVGGMEWQGMFWIGPDMFTGTLPGLGGLGSLGGSTGSPIDTQSISEFTVVHELAHQWWQGIVGLDQTAYEVIDEPLAQFSGCLYFRTVHPGTAAGACALNVTMNYQMMRLLGMPDAPANRPTYSYSNPLVYA
ncbi:MAG: hypothetical protein ACR2JQ_01200, partial [Mycobacteriales bacterium]